MNRIGPLALASLLLALAACAAAPPRRSYVPPVEVVVRSARRSVAQPSARSVPERARIAAAGSAAR